MNNIDKIVEVSIDLSTPPVDSESFDNILLVGPEPATPPSHGVPDVGIYDSLKSVNDAGWKSTGDDADPIGIAAMVAFSQSPKPAKIYIAPMKLVTVSGTIVLEDPITALDRAITKPGWYIVCPAGVDESDFESIAFWTEAQTKFFAFTYLANTPPVGDVYYRSAGWYGKEYPAQDIDDVPAANKYMSVAAAAKCLGYQAGAETWANKQLAAVYPSEFTSSFEDGLKTANINYYLSVASRNVTFGGKTMSGEWIDIIRFRDWLKNDMQMRVLALMLSVPKLPYTDPGISLVDNQVRACLKSAQGDGSGGIAPNEYDEDGNLIPGFTVSVPLAASLTAAERASRVLTRVKFSARLAGAIHLVEIRGSLAY